ncbi:MAG: guanylate kinase, partial [Deltaproteobacteria bacterium]|nr:guanylate kinase [Deltaproteobacteria bacterium]
FVDQETFNTMEENDQFVEWAHVHGNSYGTSLKEIKTAASNQMDLIFDIDYQGARQIKERYSDAIAIFILPPSIDELKRRLSSRGTETPESLEKRFTAALGEISHFEEFDFLLVNDNIDDAYDKLRSILVSQRITTSKVKENAKKLLS